LTRDRLRLHKKRDYCKLLLNPHGTTTERFLAEGHVAALCITPTNPMHSLRDRKICVDTESAELAQAPSDPIEFPDDEGIARREIRDRALEPGSRSQRPRCGILVNDGASGGAQRVELQRRRLFVRRHARVADQPRRPGSMTCGVIGPR
jgi:hypothetical protein